MKCLVNRGALKQLEEIIMSNQIATCVYYDGACPLCSREVKLYKKLVLKEGNDADIDWIDISKSRKEIDEEGIIYEDAMRLIHIKDSSGVHQVGLDGILTLWDKLPYYRRASRFIRKFPRINSYLARFYEFFAKHRMKLPGRIKQ